jgi:sulfite dehydrogenase (quinone) subunit SoeC
MHPAYSIILFTTASGIGYGMLAILGALYALDLVPTTRDFIGTVLVLALALVGAGLLSSTAHLGRPERAWRALTQWRSSWLSREGVLVLLTFVPVGLFAWESVIEEPTGESIALWSLLAAAGALLTVWSTSMIYASLKAIPRWHSGWVPAVYLSLSLATGACWLEALLHLFGPGRGAVSAIAGIAIAVAWVCKRSYWKATDDQPPTATAATATGLTGAGDVRLLDLPNTSANFVQREMGYRVARKHATRLRRLAVVFTFIVPAIGVICVFALSPLPGALAAILGALSITVGVAIERWLFFAEAVHVVTLFHGRTSV